MTIINEVVYADKGKINDKKKTIGISYDKGSNRANNNANPLDKLGTDEMDKENANTIEVPLKCGLMSYNITDIKGTEIMHYFKKKWAREQNVSIDVKYKDGSKEAYQLEMDNNDERNFINRFVHKVELVIKAWMGKNKRDDIIYSDISILPVDSTSNFNKKFVTEELSKMTIYGLECHVVNPNMIIKDVKNLERDEDFISKNKKFYNSDYAIGKPEMGTVNQRVNDIISRNKALNIVNEKIIRINEITQKLLNFLNNNKKLNELSPLQIKNLTYYYKLYVDLIRECYAITYIGEVDNKEHAFNHEDILNAIKYSKGPSIDNRSNFLWKLVKPYLRGQISSVDEKAYKQIPLCKWKKSDFEIKTLRNSERLGLKNIYSVNSNWDEKQLQDEINKIKGTILLIFDDNISGGATLSDVCLQCKNLGLDNIIPVTFGKMTESNSMGGLTINTPIDGYDFSNNGNLSIYSGEKKGKRKYVKKVDAINNGKELFYKTHNVKGDTLNILWLDDVREPYSYFSKPKNSGIWKLNNDYYSKNVFSRYNPNFIWVKNLKEFQDYILNNGMPDMVSFDHDIKPKYHVGKFENGEDVAKWFVSYCNKNNLKLPFVFSHSANLNGREQINNILSNNVNENKEIIKLSETDFRRILKETLTDIFNFPY